LSVVAFGRCHGLRELGRHGRLEVSTFRLNEGHQWARRGRTASTRSDGRAVRESEMVREGYYSCNVDSLQHDG